MYDVIIFGTGSGSLMVESALKDEANILYYVDNDSTKWNTFKNNKKILKPSRVLTTKYDYIIIASQFNESICKQLVDMGIEKKKIFEFFKYTDYNNNYIKNQLNNFELIRNSEILVTGISYMYDAIDVAAIGRVVSNFANASQDLYYDYNLAKYLLENRDKYFCIYKYALIGLCYYSFEYDMSLSAMKGKVPLYYEVIGKCHNLKNINEVVGDIESNKMIAAKILKLDKNSAPIIDWNDKVSAKIKIDDSVGKIQAQRDSSKNYPNTVKENILILKEYLSLLIRNNIKPIIVVCPVTKYYSNHFPQQMRDEFYYIINEISKQYKFQILDYFYSDLFEDKDFMDVSHLNKEGSKKFTEELKKKINWDIL